MARPCFKLEKVHPDPVAGVDEAGSAPLAGPVVAAAVVLDRERFPRGIDDSKVVPVKDRTPQQKRAVYRLLKFLADHNDQWARTGHLPAYTAVIESAEFKALPHRSNIAGLARTGQTLPAAVQRQYAIGDIIGDELTSAITAGKPAGEALSDAEDRVNDLLFHLL